MRVVQQLARCTGVLLGLALATAPGAAVYAQSKSIAVTAEAPASQRRIALVIGNAAYAGYPLRNPVNDARAMAAKLRALGFDVTEKENVDGLDLKVAIDTFGDRLKAGGVGLFYYSGHGAQFRGQNYLIPVDARLTNAVYAENSSVPAQQVLDDMARAGNTLNIVILDACRNDPFPSATKGLTRGLARMEAARGTLIAYATSPGETASDGSGRHSPYTAALLQHLSDPGVPVEQVFKRVAREVDHETTSEQTPWYTSSVLGDFYFAGRSSAPPVQAAQPLVTEPPPPPQVAESSSNGWLYAFAVVFGLASAQQYSAALNDYHWAQTTAKTDGATSMQYANDEVRAEKDSVIAGTVAAGFLLWAVNRSHTPETSDARQDWALAPSLALNQRSLAPAIAFRLNW